MPWVAPPAARMMAMALLIASGAGEALAFSDRDKQRIVEYMERRTGRSDREAIAQVYVPAIVRGEVRRADWDAYTGAVLKLLEDCDVSAGDMVEDQAGIGEIMGLDTQSLMTEGLDNIR